METADERYFNRSISSFYVTRLHMGAKFTDYKYFNGEKMAKLNDQEQLFVWEVEKEAFDAHLTTCELKELMRYYINQYHDIGIVIRYPYDT